VTAPSSRRGEQGELDAEHFLTARGLRLIQRNYRCRSGEIDRIMIDASTDDAAEVLVFVEVRLRGAGAHVDAVDSIDAAKRRRLRSAARHFLMEQPKWLDHPCRFDVVALNARENRLEWLPAAFDDD